MAGRMKEILAYSGVVFVFLYAWYSLDISDLMGNGTNWIPSPILSLHQQFLHLGIKCWFFYT